MMTKILNIVLAIGTLSFAALYFSSNEQTDIPTVELNSLSDSSDLKKENLLLKQQVKKLTQELELLKNMPGRVVKVSAKTQPINSQPKVEVSEGVAAFKETMQDPAVQAMMKKRRDDIVNDRYGKLLDRLDLSVEDKEKLVTLLGDKFLYRMQGYMKLRAAETDEDKENIKALQEEQNINNENQIADLLGAKYDTFNDYQQKRDEYRMLENLNKSEGSSSLSQAQTDHLAAVMKDTSDAFEFSNSEIQDNPRAYRELSDEDKKQYKLELQERDAQILEQVADTLSEAQLQQFKKEQKRNRDRLTSSRGGSPFARRDGRR
ncbi:MAG: hypothetical protein MK132_01455 [Lentisphaerales bacterium]|nr:hypothetical protein [Lentisphaerales bacterium]